MSIEEELRTLIERNYVKLLDQLATLTRLLDARGQGGSLGHGSIIEAQGLTHQMKGAAGTIGLALWAPPPRPSMRASVCF